MASLLLLLLFNHLPPDITDGQGLVKNTFLNVYNFFNTVYNQIGEKINENKKESLLRCGRAPAYKRAAHFPRLPRPRPPSKLPLLLPAWERVPGSGFSFAYVAGLLSA
jgi:hypothetical protein